MTNREISRSSAREESEDPRNYISGFEYGGVSCSSRHKPRKPNIRLPYPILNKNNIVLYKAAFKILLDENKTENVPTFGYLFSLRQLTKLLANPLVISLSEGKTTRRLTEYLIN